MADQTIDIPNMSDISDNKETEKVLNSVAAQLAAGLSISNRISGQMSSAIMNIGKVTAAVNAVGKEVNLNGVKIQSVDTNITSGLSNVDATLNKIAASISRGEGTEKTNRSIGVLSSRVTRLADKNEELNGILSGFFAEKRNDEYEDAENKLEKKSDLVVERLDTVITSLGTANVTLRRIEDAIKNLNLAYMTGMNDGPMFPELPDFGRDKKTNRGRPKGSRNNKGNNKGPRTPRGPRSPKGPANQNTAPNSNGPTNQNLPQNQRPQPPANQNNQTINRPTAQPPANQNAPQYQKPPSGPPSNQVPPNPSNAVPKPTPNPTMPPPANQNVPQLPNAANQNTPIPKDNWDTKNSAYLNRMRMGQSQPKPVGSGVFNSIGNAAKSGLGMAGKGLEFLGRAAPAIGGIAAGVNEYAESGDVGKSLVVGGGAAVGTMAGAALGQALIPIPVVGALIGGTLGGMAGDWLGGALWDGPENVEKGLEKQEAVGPRHGRASSIDTVPKRNPINDPRYNIGGKQVKEDMMRNFRGEDPEGQLYSEAEKNLFEFLGDETNTAADGTVLSRKGGEHFINDEKVGALKWAEEHDKRFMEGRKKMAADMGNDPNMVNSIEEMYREQLKKLREDVYSTEEKKKTSEAPKNNKVPTAQDVLNAAPVASLAAAATAVPLTSTPTGSIPSFNSVATPASFTASDVSSQQSVNMGSDMMPAFGALGKNSSWSNWDTPAPVTSSAATPFATNDVLEEKQAEIEKQSKEMTGGQIVFNGTEIIYKASSITFEASSIMFSGAIGSAGGAQGGAEGSPSTSATGPGGMFDGNSGGGTQSGGGDTSSSGNASDSTSAAAEPQGAARLTPQEKTAIDTLEKTGVYPVAPNETTALGALSPEERTAVGVKTTEGRGAKGTTSYSYEKPKADTTPTTGTSNQQAIIREAKRLGISPTDLATTMMYESAGSMNPWRKGPRDKRDGAAGQVAKGADPYMRGLIQFGTFEQNKYGVREGMSFDEQMKVVGDYLEDRGYTRWLKENPNASEAEKRTALYSTINAGSPDRKHWSKTDKRMGGAPGTVADKANVMFNGEHRTKAEKYMEGSTYSTESAPQSLSDKVGNLTTPKTSGETTNKADGSLVGKNTTTSAGKSGVIAPVDGIFQHTPNSYYGAPRGGYAKGGRNQSGPKNRKHSGSDWTAADGSNAVFPVNGKVIHSGEHSGYGYMVDILGEDGRVYRMAPHGSVGKFKVGQEVKQGQVAGTISGKHLHMEVIPPEINGKPNPVYNEFMKNLESGTGGFVKTSNQRGTVDQAELFGLESGTKVSTSDYIVAPEKETADAVIPTSDELKKAEQKTAEKVSQPEATKPAAQSGATSMTNPTQRPYDANDASFSGSGVVNNKYGNNTVGSKQTATAKKEEPTQVRPEDVSWETDTKEKIDQNVGSSVSNPTQRPFDASESKMPNGAAVPEAKEPAVKLSEPFDKGMTASDRNATAVPVKPKETQEEVTRSVFGDEADFLPGSHLNYDNSVATLNKNARVAEPVQTPKAAAVKRTESLTREQSRVEDGKVEAKKRDGDRITQAVKNREGPEPKHPTVTRRELDSVVGRHHDWWKNWSARA